MYSATSVANMAAQTESTEPLLTPSLNRVNRYRNWRLIRWEALALAACLALAFMVSNALIALVCVAAAVVVLILLIEELLGVAVAESALSMPLRKRGPFAIVAGKRIQTKLADIHSVALLPSRLGFKRIEIITAAASYVVAFSNGDARRRFIDDLRARQPGIETHTA